MSLLSVVKDVCLAVGVNPMASMFATSIQPRTQAEMLSLANEMSQRIADDFREWRELKAIAVLPGPGIVDPPPAVPVSRLALPANFRRMLLTAQVYPSWASRQSLRFVSDTDEWLVRRLNGDQYSWGEWTLIGSDMLVYPALQSGQAVTFAYLDKNCIRLASGGFGDTFMSDDDAFVISERLLKLGMIWQWKANKGSPYAEDMGTYSDALVMLSGANNPAPIIMDHGGRGRIDAGQLQQ
jgi:hypothetical protein